MIEIETTVHVGDETITIMLRKEVDAVELRGDDRVVRTLYGTDLDILADRVNEAVKAVIPR